MTLVSLRRATKNIAMSCIAVKENRQLSDLHLEITIGTGLPEFTTRESGF